MIEIIPWDNETHEPAARFCRDILGAEFDRSLLQQAWLAREGERVLGVAAIQARWDIPVFRSIDPKATFKMAERMNSYFADRGVRGQDVFLFLSQSESPEQQCPARDRILEKMAARPAGRYVMTVR